MPNSSSFIRSWVREKLGITVLELPYGKAFRVREISTKTEARTDRAEEFAVFLAKDAELNLSKMVPLTEDRLVKAKRLVRGELLD